MTAPRRTPPTTLGGMTARVGRVAKLWLYACSGAGGFGIVVVVAGGTGDGGGGGGPEQNGTPPEQV